MIPEKRRAIAYIAARLISRINSTAVYDYQGSQYTYMGGQISNSVISIFDYGRSVYITGNSSGTGNFSLFDYGTSQYLTLSIRGKTFNGYDYQTGTYFSGTVNGKHIYFFDYQTSLHYNYSI